MFGNGSCMVLDDFSLPGAIYPWFLYFFRRTIFDLVYSLSHPVVKATKKLLSQCWVWPGINSDATKWTHACIHCQRSKVQRHTKSPLVHLSLSSKHFKTVHIDLVGPLPQSFFFTMAYRFTSWVKVVPLEDTKTTFTFKGLQVLVCCVEGDQIDRRTKQSFICRRIV